jgi:hypothetical protein
VSFIFTHLGFPSVIVGFWAVFKAFATHDKGSKEAAIECEWMRETNHDWIIKAPACLVLIINLIFLIRIMFVSFLTNIYTLFHINIIELSYFAYSKGSNNKAPISKFN